MKSLKERAAAIGLPGNFSVVHDFFGHLSQPSGLSLATQIDRLAFRRININLIRVGSNQFSSADIEEVDGAVKATRDMYAPAQLAIARVFHYEIPTADANGAEHIGSDAEAEDLTEDWTVPNDALDVFVVLTYAGSTVGLSPEGGPCDKNSKGMNGPVVAIEGSPFLSGQVLAHEMGHYLGLPHVNDRTNLMNPSGPNGGGLTAAQGNIMRNHCFVRG